MKEVAVRPCRGLRIVILVARVAGIVAAVPVIRMLVAYAVNPQGEGEGGLPEEWLLMLFFPIGMALGYLLAWRWTPVGGAISLGCIVIFLLAEDQADQAGVMAILGAPAIALIISGLVARHCGSSAVARQAGPR